MQKSAEFFGGFRHIKKQKLYFKLAFAFAYKSGFCSALNESPPFCFINTLCSIH